MGLVEYLICFLFVVLLFFVFSWPETRNLTACLCLCRYIIYYRFINPAIVSPDDFAMAEGQVTMQQRVNLISVSKILSGVSNNKTLEGDGPGIAMVNKFIKDQGARMATFFAQVTDDVPDPSTHLRVRCESLSLLPLAFETAHAHTHIYRVLLAYQFVFFVFCFFFVERLSLSLSFPPSLPQKICAQIDRKYMEYTQTQKPQIYISPNEMFFIHRFIRERLDKIAKDPDDPLRALISSLPGTPPRHYFLLLALFFRARFWFCFVFCLFCSFFV